jgi:hypothetical protein
MVVEYHFLLHQTYDISTLLEVSQDFTREMPYRRHTNLTLVPLNWMTSTRDISLHLPPIQPRKKQVVVKEKSPTLVLPENAFVKMQAPSLLPNFPSVVEADEPEESEASTTSLEKAFNFQEISPIAARSRRPSHFDPVFYLKQKPTQLPYQNQPKQRKIEHRESLPYLPKILGRQASTTVIVHSQCAIPDVRHAKTYTRKEVKHHQEDEIDIMIRLSNLSAAYGTIDKGMTDFLSDVGVRERRIRLLALKKVEYCHNRLQDRIENRARVEKQARKLACSD